MRPGEDAWAGLAEDVGRALLSFAERLRLEADRTAALSARGGATPGEQEGTLGGAQLKVLTAVRAAEDGVTSQQIAKATGLESSNTPRILKTLREKGLVTASDSRPAVWTAS